MADESPKINPKPPTVPTPDPWHDGPTDAATAEEAAAPDTAAEPAAKKIPDPWHD